MKKELSVFHENCCGFGPPKVKIWVKVKKGNISKSKAKMKKLKILYFLELLKFKEIKCL